MQEIQLSPEEIARYSRHLLVEEFGMEGQLRLKQAKVLVVGAGGLGCPLLLYLAAAGVGTIGIIDFDTVEESNLQRQILYTIDDIGKPKVDVAKKKLLAINPYIHIITYQQQLSAKNALEIFSSFDIVADGTDNFVTRYLVNDACVFSDIPNVYASILQFEGQVSVFNYKEGPNYRDIFPVPPAPNTIPNCAEAGVLGVLPGIIGSMQANEVIKVISGIGTPLSGRLFIFDALHFSSKIFTISKDKNNPLTGDNPTIKALTDVDLFCGATSSITNEISVQQLKEMFDTKEDIQLIDVREHYEYNQVNLGGICIPLHQLKQSMDLISKEKKVIVHCKTGMRSAKAVQLLLDNGYRNVYNLNGGIIVYAKEIDNQLPLY
ncbi:MAG TPA: molybdopterin-synthase adenylyltransferase MoeB [Chitinophagales bacterium]|nr:molybdopterin-synthase adenylyltransferase MoeB [Chitinophagales bacterium]HMY23813.1 molybdopterin-synthase adenylyltransferase MoeB [Chitinophagales bacterium]HMZ34031.1 molybdopterin-synthase adenylyltransferase MoeB [Chitinophagales bacterium]HNA38446.1 molybdopterin-synthase adenylyltransferase MoeB [Chitinophagales bacterium]HNC72724.1 molybdopterin-synthase adenylyltransferase MoeB [Chitinophagales bacterium]